jgi:hypothetical protein
MVYAAEYSARVSSELSVPGRTLINEIPVLKYIPPWFPGAYTQRLAASAKQTLTQHQAGLFEHVKRNMVNLTPNTQRGVFNNFLSRLRVRQMTASAWWQNCCSLVQKGMLAGMTMTTSNMLSVQCILVRSITYVMSYAKTLLFRGSEHGMMIILLSRSRFTDFTERLEAP